MKPSAYQFILPHKEKVFARPNFWNRADKIIFDLQDGCPTNRKQEGRENIKKYLRNVDRSMPDFIVRINEFSKADAFNADLDLLNEIKFHTVMLPYINSIEDVSRLDQCLTELEENSQIQAPRTNIILLIETAFSLHNLSSLIKASDRIVGLALGLHDLSADLGCELNESNTALYRNLINTAAKSAGIDYIDSPYVNINDAKGHRVDCINALEAGADAKMFLHPDQSNIVNEVFKLTSGRKAEIEEILKEFKGGCLNNSKHGFIGPPKIRSLKKELERGTHLKNNVVRGAKGRSFSYGLDLEKVRTGQLIQCPYEITLDYSWNTIWHSLNSAGNYIETSDQFCKKIGLERRLLPYSAVLNITLCMAVEPFSESCLLHLGLEDVTYEKPVYADDTVKCFIYIEDLRNTSDHKRSVITSQHVLINQKNERVFSFRRKTLFPRIEGLEKRLPEESTQPLLEIIKQKSSQGLALKMNDANLKEYQLSQFAFERGELLLHDACRRISESENLLFTTLFRNTHPVHFNYLRYTKKELIICGGFVLSVVLSNALKDLKQVVDQKIISCSHFNKINPDDTISSISYIHNSEVKDGFEVLTLKTLGLIDTDTQHLSDQLIPTDIFNKEEIRPSDFEKKLEQQFPELLNKVCLQVLWEVKRPLEKINGLGV